jgi:hypothetical protein
MVRTVAVLPFMREMRIILAAGRVDGEGAERATEWLDQFERAGA